MEIEIPIKSKEEYLILKEISKGAYTTKEIGEKTGIIYPTLWRKLQGFVELGGLTKIPGSSYREISSNSRSKSGPPWDIYTITQEYEEILKYYEEISELAKRAKERRKGE